MKTFDLDRPSQILPSLFLGSYGAACDEEGLHRLGITHVLTLMNEARLPKPRLVVQLQVDVSDYGDTRLVAILPTCRSFIEEGLSAGAVLLHCALGVNRSPAVLIAYLIAFQGWTLLRAYEQVIQQRPVISPCGPFLDQLAELEKEHRGVVSVDPDDLPSLYPPSAPPGA